MTKQLLSVCAAALVMNRHILSNVAAGGTAWRVASGERETEARSRLTAASAPEKGRTKPNNGTKRSRPTFP